MELQVGQTYIISGGGLSEVVKILEHIGYGWYKVSRIPATGRAIDEFFLNIDQAFKVENARI